MRKYSDESWDEYIGYENTDNLKLGEDRVLCKTLLYEGYWLRHEPNDTCWCEPEVIPVVEDEEVVGYINIHRDIQ